MSSLRGIVIGVTVAISLASSGAARANAAPTEAAPAESPPAAEKAPPPTPTRGVAPHDRNTIQRVHDFNLMEIQMGKLAQANGASRAVKAYGRNLVEDHTKAEKQLDDYLRARGTNIKELATTSVVDPDHELLATKTGTEFDLAFGLQMVADNTKAIELLESARIETGDEALLTYYEQMIKTLQAHKRAAQDIVAAASPRSDRRKSNGHVFAPRAGL